MAEAATETPSTPTTADMPSTGTSEAVAPVEKKAELPGITGTPVAAPESAATPEPKIDSPRPEESLSPIPAPESEDGKAKKGSRFFKLHGSGDVLKEAWGDNDFCCALEQMVPNNKIKKSRDGLEFELENGHKIAWRTRPDGQEFIGFNRIFFKQDFDESDAKAIILAAAARGWGEVNVHGDAKAKGMLWLEAQRMGMKVGNFNPGPGSEFAKIWEAENETGATKSGDKPVAETKHTHAAEAAEEPKKEDPKGDEPTTSRTTAPVRKAASPAP